MLTLRLKSGEYVAIGSEIAVQVFRQKGNSFELAVKAPREVPVCRGQLYERKNPRPEGLRACITSRRRKTDWHLGAKAFAVFQRA